MSTYCRGAAHATFARDVSHQSLTKLREDLVELGAESPSNGQRCGLPGRKRGHSRAAGCCHSGTYPTAWSAETCGGTASGTLRPSIALSTEGEGLGQGGQEVTGQFEDPLFENGVFQGNNQQVARNLRISENLFLNAPLNLHVGTVGVEVHHNTCIGCGIGSTSAVEDAHCWNNILWGQDVTFRWETCDDNLYFTPDRERFAAGPCFRLFRWTPEMKEFRSSRDWQEGTGLDAHLRVMDPQFVDAAGRDYHLKPNSPALGAGRGADHVGAFPPMGRCWAFAPPGATVSRCPRKSRRPKAAAAQLQRNPRN